MNPAQPDLQQVLNKGSNLKKSFIHTSQHYIRNKTILTLTHTRRF